MKPAITFALVIAAALLAVFVIDRLIWPHEPPLLVSIVPVSAREQTVCQRLPPWPQRPNPFQWEQKV